MIFIDFPLESTDRSSCQWNFQSQSVCTVSSSSSFDHWTTCMFLFHEDRCLSFRWTVKKKSFIEIDFNLCWFVCLFSSSCHRTHEKPGITNTLLAKNMYSNFQIQYSLDNEFDFGSNLFEEFQWQQTRSTFFCSFRHRIRIWRNRTLWKFSRFLFRCSTWIRKTRPTLCLQSLCKRWGSSSWKRLCSIWNVRKTNRHFSPHWKFSCSEDQAMKAYLALNTRYYAGRMVQCQFVKIANWSSAICGKKRSKKHFDISRFFFYVVSEKVCFSRVNVRKVAVVIIYMFFPIHRQSRSVPNLHCELVEKKCTLGLSLF